MRRGVLLAVLLGLSLPPVARTQQVVDRIVARVDHDVITQSDLNELGRFQKLVDGKQQPSADRLRERVEQWIVNREASLSGFRAPDAKAADKAFTNLQKRIGTPAEFEKKLKEVGLTASQVKQMLERQIFLSRYLDYKFRPEVQVNERQIEEYYRKTLVPELKRAGQNLPPLASVADKIREVLVERGINQRATEWLDEMRARWKVEKIGGDSSP
jgi:peptidyl-prolyl cis-trans isomerase SurA